MNSDLLKKVETEANELIKLARQQLEEWKQALLDAALSVEPKTVWAGMLMVAVRKIELDVVTTKNGELVVQYDVPDEFINCVINIPEGLVVPEVIKNSLKGSRIVSESPTAVPDKGG